MQAHQTAPFHWAQEWTGQFFARKDLCKLGLVYTLGHAGDICPSTLGDDGGIRFIVVDVNGIHTTRLRFCSCPGSGTHARQLTKARLFPATIERPETAFTFDVLKQFHIHCFESKRSAFDYIGALRRMTDNTGTEVVPVRLLSYSVYLSNICGQDPYSQFLRVVRIWRVLTMEKHSGQVHTVDGVTPHVLGSLLVRCPACPRPLINMDPNWEQINESHR